MADSQTSEAMQLCSDNLVGRPTLYTPELVNKANDYLINYKVLGKNIPSIARLSQHLDISRDRLYKWAKQEDKKELKYILDKIMVLQEIELTENGLNGDYNSNIVKLMLGKHGYSDKPTERAGSKITVNVNRGNVTIESGSEKLRIDTDTVIEHDDSWSNTDINR